MNKTHNTPQEQKQISIQLGSHSRIAFQVWDEERGRWFKSESSAPLRDRDIPRPTQKRILEPAPKGGWRTRMEEIPEDAPVYRNMEHLCRLLQHNKELVLGVETTGGEHCPHLRAERHPPPVARLYSCTVCRIYSRSRC